MKKRALSLASGITIGLASILFNPSYMAYGEEQKTITEQQSTTQPAFHASRPSRLEESVYELPEVESEEIKEVEFEKPDFSVPDVKIPFIISLSNDSESIFKKQDYDEALKSLNEHGSSYSIDKKTGKIKALAEPTGKKTVVKNLEGKVLYKVKRGDKEVCVFDNQKTRRRVVAEYIDFVSKIGLVKGKSFGEVLFDTDSGKIVYKEKQGEIEAFSDTGQVIVGMKEQGYFLKNIRTREEVKLFDYQEGVDFFMSPNGEYVGWKVEETGDVGVYQPSTGEVRYSPSKDSVLKIDDEGNLYTKDKKSERKTNFKEMVKDEEAESR